MRIVVLKGMESDMIIFKGELPLNHEPSLNSIAKNYANNYDEDEFTTEDWEYLYDQAWSWIEQQLTSENLIMEHVNND